VYTSPDFFFKYIINIAAWNSDAAMAVLRFNFNWVPPPHLVSRRGDALARGEWGGGPNSDDWTETVVLGIV
jgi:hypothetical protein